MSKKEENQSKRGSGNGRSELRPKFSSYDLFHGLQYAVAFVYSGEGDIGKMLTIKDHKKWSYYRQYNDRSLVWGRPYKKVKSDGNKKIIKHAIPIHYDLGKDGYCEITLKVPLDDIPFTQFGRLSEDSVFKESKYKREGYCNWTLRIYPSDVKTFEPIYVQIQRGTFIYYRLDCTWLTKKQLLSLTIESGSELSKDWADKFGNKKSKVRKKKKK